MIRIEIDDGGSIKQFEMKGIHADVIEQCGIALYSIIYAFSKQYRDISYPNTNYDYIGNIRGYFYNIMDCAELGEKGDLPNDIEQALEKMHNSCRIMLTSDTKEPPEPDKIFMQVTNNAEQQSLHGNT